MAQYGLFKRLVTKLSGRVLGRYGHTIGPRPMKPYMGLIKVVRGTVWCPICPSRTIWGKLLFYAQFLGRA